jgi:hypothetical protein
MAHEVQFNSTEMQETINILLQLFGTTLFVNVTVKELMEGKAKNLNKKFIFLLELIRLYRSTNRSRKFN